MKVYTRTGDKGTSQLYNGERRPKDDLVFEALGCTDELNAMLGLSRTYVAIDMPEGQDAVGLVSLLDGVMSRLFDVGSAVATPLDTTKSQAKLARSAFDATGAVLEMENAIDRMDEELPPLKNFILPSGGAAASHLHVARTFARRAERRVVPLITGGHVHNDVGIFLNRLSDFLFVSARYVAMKSGNEETIYKKQKEVTKSSTLDDEMS